MTTVERTSTKTLSTRYIAVTGILSAVAFVLQYIEVSLPFMPWFIKLDFSDLPALIGSFSFGPLCGVLIEAIKNLIHLPFTQTFGIGELSNFILGAVFCAVAGYFYQKDKSKKGALVGSLIGALCMAIVSFPSNLFIVYPVYYSFMPQETILQTYQLILPWVGSIEQCLLVFNVPFTFAKGMVDVLITFLVYKKISPVLHGRH